MGRAKFRGVYRPKWRAGADPVPAVWIRFTVRGHRFRKDSQRATEHAAAALRHAILDAATRLSQEMTSEEEIEAWVNRCITGEEARLPVPVVMPAPAAPVVPSLSFRDAIERFLSYVGTLDKPMSAAGQRDHRLWLGWWADQFRARGVETLAALTRDTIEQALPVLRHEGMRTETRRKYARALKAWLAWADTENLFPGANPATKVRDGLWPSKPTKDEQAPKWALDYPSACRLLRAAFDAPPLVSEGSATKGKVFMPTPGPLLAAFLYSGGRLESVATLRAEDVDVDAPAGKGRVRLKKGTKGRPYAHVLDPDFRDILREHLGERRTGLLFPTRNKKPIASAQWLDLVRHIHAHAVATGGPLMFIAPDGERCEAAPGTITANTLRHTYDSACCQLTKDGAPLSLKDLQVRMGHSSKSDLALTVYAHVDGGFPRGEYLDFRPKLTKVGKGSEEASSDLKVA